MINQVDSFNPEDNITSPIDLFSNYLILGFNYKETYQIRDILYHRMIKRLPKQIEKNINKSE